MNNSNPQMQTTQNKRLRLDDSTLLSGLQQMLMRVKIIKCEECQHFARHPNTDAFVNGLRVLTDELSDSPKCLIFCRANVFPCIQNRCTHNCTHMTQAMMNLQIINCGELRHIISRKALRVTEVKHDEKNVLACSLNNCTNDCKHMVPLQSITRYNLI